MSPQPAPAPAAIHKPFLHDLVATLHAPYQAWSQPDGTMGTPERDGPVVADGIYLGDTRIVSTLHLEADGAVLAPLPPLVRSAREVELRHVVVLPDAPSDPVVELRQVRRTGSTGFSEQIRLVSVEDRAIEVSLRVRVRPDVTGMSVVKHPRTRPEDVPPAPPIALDAKGATARWQFATEGSVAQLRLAGSEADSGGASVAAALSADGDCLLLDLRFTAPAGGGSSSVTWEVSGEDPSLPFVGVESDWAAPILAALCDIPTADPEHLAADRLLHRSLSDLDSLRMQVPGRPEQSFFAAGAPWYFTLFGRDSLITASLTLPLDTGIAADTLRVLAAHQGTAVDVDTAEQPGKILHEMRGVGIDMGEAYLPPVYYGTIDATPLWIELLHDARRAGLDREQVAALRPHLEAAATWLLEHGDADGDGFLEYIDESGHGLANQGWKDSWDSVRFADGTIAEGTIALAEVQGYAYAAALHAAELLENLGGESRELGAAGASDELPARLRSWAATLRERFHASFWCEDDRGKYVALALDGHKQRVDGVASNMGHLLGTGLLDAAQERLVVDRLLDPTMFSGYGVRTLSSDNGAYWPLRYHGGSVWTHDTAYILRGMLRSGFEKEAAVLARGLLRAAAGFEDRLPELFSGEDATSAVTPMPYPASCRPQAWAAASAVPVAQALGVLIC